MNQKIDVFRHSCPPLHTYELSEDEIRKLSTGNDSQVYLNFMIAFFSIALSILVSLMLTSITNVEYWKLSLLHILMIVGFGAGLFMLVLWWRNRGNQDRLVTGILSRPLAPSGDDSQELLSGETADYPQEKNPDL